MGYEQYTTEEIARIGEEIYQTRIRPEVEAQHHGEFVVLDILTGSYAVGASDLAASQEMIGRDPAAVLYGVRAGYDYVYSLGGHALGSGR